MCLGGKGVRCVRVKSRVVCACEVKRPQVCVWGEVFGGEGMWCGVCVYVYVCVCVIVVDIACGSLHCVCCTSDGMVFT